jgi:hypothetical protein
MTNDKEEQLIWEQLISKQAAYNEAKKIAEKAKSEADKIKFELEELEQAAKDYMLGNGVVDSEHFSLRVSEAVIVPDIDALPDEYIRIKKEANKQLIKAARPQANWYGVEKRYNLQVKGEKVI